MTKIQLIFPKSEKSTGRTGYLWQPPLGLLSIATYIKQKNPTLEIEVLNGELMSENKLIAQIGADYIGLSCNLLNYNNCIKLAKIAKRKGTKVVLGGVYTDYFSNYILEKRDCFDVIIRGEGERAFNDIINNKPYENIKNIVFKKNSKIVYTSREILDLDDLPIIDRSFINLNDYFHNFKKVYPASRFSRATTYYSQKGCLWKQSCGGCIFCARNDSYRTRDPKKIWEEIRYLVNEYQIDYLFDQSDTFTLDKKWLFNFVKSKPKDINIHFKVWARSSDINEKTAQLLKELGVFDVFIGIESGDNDILKKANKGTTIRQNLKAVEILKKYGIKTFVVFVTGLLGETKTSLDRDIEHAQRLLKVGDIEKIACDNMIPLPGSKSFEMLKNKLNFSPKDTIDLKELQHHWIKNFTNVSEEEASSYCNKIRELNPNNF